MMITLNRLLRDHMEFSITEHDILLDILMTIIVNTHPEDKLDRNNVSPNDILNIRVYNDNLNNYNYNSRYEEPFQYSMTFEIRGSNTSYSFPLACYIAASYDRYTVANVTGMLAELKDDTERNMFIRCLKLNNKIKSERTKLWIQLL
jgi:hypothetical protein